MWIWMLWGCVDEERLAEEMERGLAHAAEAVPAALVTAELTRWVDEPATTTVRHAIDCACPCREQPADVPDELWLEYAELGCLPDSGLVPFATRGLLVVERDADTAIVNVAEFVVDRRLEVSGSAQASRAAVTDVVGALTIGPVVAQSELQVRHDVDRVTFDGDLEIDGTTITLHELVVPLDAVGGDCPIPTAGHVSLGGERGPIEVHPVGDGEAEARYDGRLSDRVPWCTFHPGWW